MPMSNIVCCFI